MEHGRLIEMGQLTTVDSDGNKTNYKMALLIEFASVAEIKQAINEGKCTFGWCEEVTPNVELRGGPAVSSPERPS